MKMLKSKSVLEASFPSLEKRQLKEMKLFLRTTGTCSGRTLGFSVSRWWPKGQHTTAHAFHTQTHLYLGILGRTWPRKSTPATDEHATKTQACMKTSAPSSRSCHQNRCQQSRLG